MLPISKTSKYYKNTLIKNCCILVIFAELFSKTPPFSVKFAEHENNMNKTELEQILYFLDLNNREACKILGISERSLYNYLHGQKIPLYISNFVDCLCKLKKIDNTLQLIIKGKK